MVSIIILKVMRSEALVSTMTVKHSKVTAASFVGKRGAVQHGVVVVVVVVVVVP